MLYLVLEDFAAGSFSATAGSLLDSSTIDLAPLQAAGLAVILYSPATMAAARSAFLAARGSKPTTPDTSGDLTALLLAAGALGDGGITELSGDVLAGPGSGSQAATVVGLQGNPVSASAPSASGQVLTWNGTDWLPAAPSGGGGGGGQVYYLNSGTAGTAPLPDPAAKALALTAQTGLTTITSGTLPNNGTYAPVAWFVTNPGVPGATSIPAGLWDSNVWARASGPSNNANTVRFRVQVYKWDGTTATLLSTSGIVPLYDPSQVVQYATSALLPQTSLLSTDRIAVAIYATATANNHQLILSFGDSYPTHIHTTFPSAGAQPSYPSAASALLAWDFDGTGASIPNLGTLGAGDADMTSIGASVIRDVPGPVSGGVGVYGTAAGSRVFTSQGAVDLGSSQFTNAITMVAFVDLATDPAAIAAEYNALVKGRANNTWGAPTETAIGWYGGQFFGQVVVAGGNVRVAVASTGYGFRPGLHMLGYTYDGTTGTSRLYYDGVEVSSAVQAAATIELGLNVGTNEGPWNVGGNFATNNAGMRGVVYAARVYTAVQSAAWMKQAWKNANGWP